MKLSTRARYAIRMMYLLSQSDDPTQPMRLDEVAEQTNLSRRYLDQLVLPLKSAGLLRGVKGPGGGYLLGRAPDKIAIGEIVEAEIGPLGLVDCVFSPETCDLYANCTCKLIYQLASVRLRTTLYELTLADLQNPEKVATIKAEIAAGSPNHQ